MVKPYVAELRSSSCRNHSPSCCHDSGCPTPRSTRTNGCDSSSSSRRWRLRSSSAARRLSSMLSSLVTERLLSAAVAGGAGPSGQGGSGIGRSQQSVQLLLRQRRQLSHLG